MKKCISQAKSHASKGFTDDELEISIRSKGIFKSLGEALVIIVFLQGMPGEVINQTPPNISIQDFQGDYRGFHQQ